jgi:alkylation response protein AidB-like acyl-CoA dehydrogenase
MTDGTELDRLMAWLAENGNVGRRLAAAARQPADALTSLARQLALHRWLYDAGWLRMGWPESVGGTVESPTMRAAIYETLARSGVVPPTTVNSLEVIGPMLLRDAPELAREFLPELISGAAAWCQGFSEPESGSDLASLRLRATKSSVGWRLSGQKVWSTRAYGATRCLVLARTGGQEERHRALSLMLVDMSSPGLVCRPIADMAGTEHFGEIFFDDVEVRDDRVVGPPGSGWLASMYLFAWERGMYAWLRQSALHATLLELSPYTREDDVAVELLGAALADVTALRLRSLSTIRALEAGRDVGPLVSVDKLLLSRAERSVQDLAIRVRPIGFKWSDDPDQAVHAYEYLHSRSAGIYGGSAEIQRTIVATRLLGLPRMPP